MAVDHAITGAHLVAVFCQDTYHNDRNPDLVKGVIHCTWRAAGSVLQILTGMVVLIWHWYRSSAGDGSLASMGVARIAKRVSCGSMPLYLACWSACFTDFTHASVNPFDYR